MANREENLKKINAELEKLTDEQLDAVAGGHMGILGQRILRQKRQDDANAQEPLNDEPILKTGRA